MHSYASSSLDFAGWNLADPANTLQAFGETITSEKLVVQTCFL